MFKFVYGDKDQQKCDKDKGQGSGTLTSATRMVTAHHVIDSVDFAAPGDSLAVGFGGGCHVGTNPNCDGHFSGRYKRETPFLANRLFQLGLDEWARNSTVGGVNAIGARSWIRNWTFEFDDVDRQPFGRRGSRRDVAVLKAKPVGFPFKVDDRYDLSPFYTPSGKFVVDKPGMFFGQVLYDRWHDEATDGETPGDLYAFSVNQPTDDPTSNLVPLVANPGYTEGTEVGCAPNKEACILDSGDDWVHPVSYKHCVSTTLDGVSGSSGGAIGYQREGYEGSFFFRAHATEQGCSVPDYQPPNDVDCDLWATQHDVDPERPDERWQSIATTSTDTVRKWSDRDKSYADRPDPFHAVPHQVDTDGRPPRCTTHKRTKTGLCKSVSKPASNDLWGRPRAGLTIGLYSGEQNPGHSPPPDHQGRRYLCNYAAFDELGPRMRTHAGIAVGFIGASTKTRTPGSVVGSLSIICAPWTAQPWADNWRWLFVDGPPVKPGYDATGAFVPRAMLRWALPLSFEWRYSPQFGADYPRPMSMRMCPPNYFMNGVWVNEKDGILVGISGLQCETPRGESLVKSLEAAASDFGNYTLNGRRFPLDQRIGNAGGARLIQCKDRHARAVMGFDMVGNSDGPIKEFHLECGPQPRPRR